MQPECTLQSKNLSPDPLKKTDNLHSVYANQLWVWHAHRTSTVYISRNRLSVNHCFTITWRSCAFQKESRDIYHINVYFSILISEFIDIHSVQQPADAEKIFIIVDEAVTWIPAAHNYVDWELLHLLCCQRRLHAEIAIYLFLLL